MKNYAQSEYIVFVERYRNSSFEPPHFILNPPNKDELVLDCLNSIENAVHIDFTESIRGEVTVNFDQQLISNVEYIDVQLSRRSSCWFDAPCLSICSIPRDMNLHMQVETVSEVVSEIKISLRSRYNLQYARCNAMELPPEKLAFLPVMFETFRIYTKDRQILKKLRIRNENGGHFILGQIRAYQYALPKKRIKAH